MTFHHCWLSLEKCFHVATWKHPLLTPLKKYFDAHASSTRRIELIKGYLCSYVDQFNAISFECQIIGRAMN